MDRTDGGGTTAPHDAADDAMDDRCARRTIGCDANDSVAEPAPPCVPILYRDMTAQELLVMADRVSRQQQQVSYIPPQLLPPAPPPMMRVVMMVAMPMLLMGPLLPYSRYSYMTVRLP